ncbi:MAG: hypothetical protein JSR34_09740 [Proteobacteria bacterium]|nr:hypothetical protein [Pseudomonadota bacterium]
MSNRLLRNLLLDCRAAFRRHYKQFEDDPLREKIDAAIKELDKKKDEDELPQPETRTAQQVAYAWQIAVRTLKLTHPEMYDKMAVRVRQMLDAQVLHDPASEIIELERSLQNTLAAQQGTANDLSQVYGALAEAMPLSGKDAIGSEAERALRRIERLQQAAASGVGLPKPSAPIDDPLGLTNSREGLTPVLLGRRGLTAGERAWCIAEAMVTSDRNNAELKQMADAELVKLIFG